MRGPRVIAAMSGTRAGGAEYAPLAERAPEGPPDEEERPARKGWWSLVFPEGGFLCFPADAASARDDVRGLKPPRMPTAAFDAIRGWASLQVAIGHYFMFMSHGHYFNGLCIGGGSSVLIFFLMSAFVMMIGTKPFV